MKKSYKLTLVLSILSMASASYAQSLTSMGPCPLGMFLTIKSISMVPSCVGIPLPPNIISQAAGAAVSGIEKAATNAATNAVTSAVTGLTSNNNNNNNASNPDQQAAIQQREQEWGGTTNFGLVNGFGGITVKVISCDEYASMNQSLVNPQNPPLDFEQLRELGLEGQGEVQNGWWAQKIDYRAWPSGISASQEGGAVVQYAALAEENSQNITQKVTVISTGSCGRQIVPPTFCFQNANYNIDRPNCRQYNDNGVRSGSVW